MNPADIHVGDLLLFCAYPGWEAHPQHCLKAEVIEDHGWIGEGPVRESMRVHDGQSVLIRFPDREDGSLRWVARPGSLRGPWYETYARITAPVPEPETKLAKLERLIAADMATQEELSALGLLSPISSELITVAEMISAGGDALDPYTLVQQLRKIYDFLAEKS